MNKKILVLYGNKGCGKSSIANELSSHRRWTRYSLAEPIRRMLAGAFGQELMNIFADKECSRNEFGGASIREAMIRLGTDWGRSMYENIWVDWTLDRLKNSYWVDRVVIDDARFNNEYAALKAAGAKFVRVRRAAVDESIAEQTHQSETEWPSWVPDFEVENFSVFVAAEEIQNWLNQYESN